MGGKNSEKGGNLEEDALIESEIKDRRRKSKNKKERGELTEERKNARRFESI
jgi:hypothetical protein